MKKKKRKRKPYDTICACKKYHTTGKEKKSKEIIKNQNQKLVRIFFLQDTLSAPYQSHWIIGIIRNLLKRKETRKKEKILRNGKKKTI